MHSCVRYSAGCLPSLLQFTARCTRSNSFRHHFVALTPALFSPSMDCNPSPGLWGFAQFDMARPASASGWSHPWLTRLYPPPLCRVPPVRGLAEGRAGRAGPPRRSADSRRFAPAGWRSVGSLSASRATTPLVLLLRYPTLAALFWHTAENLKFTEFRRTRKFGPLVNSCT